MDLSLWVKLGFCSDDRFQDGPSSEAKEPLPAAVSLFLAWAFGRCSSAYFNHGALTAFTSCLGSGRSAWSNVVPRVSFLRERSPGQALVSLPDSQEDRELCSPVSVSSLCVGVGGWWWCEPWGHGRAREGFCSTFLHSCLGGGVMPVSLFLSCS